jgi:manganese oxidase
VRRDQQPGDYGDPGWFRHPQGTVAREWTGELPSPARQPAPAPAPRKQSVPLDVRKPAGHGEDH